MRWAALLLVSACSGAHEVARPLGLVDPASAIEARGASIPAPSARRVDDVVADLGLERAPATPRPRWVEDPTGRPLGRGLARGEPVVGRGHALVTTPFGVFITATRGSIAGPLPFPDAAFRGFLGGDAVVVAERDGSLLRAARPEDAPFADRYRRVGSVPRAIGWDAAGRFVIATTTTGTVPPRGDATVRRSADGLTVSTDEGRTFSRARLPSATVVGALVRPDGLLFAVGGDTTVSEGALGIAEGDLVAFTSADRGGSWHELARGVRSWSRFGAAIFFEDGEGSHLVTQRGARATATPPCSSRWSEALFLGEGGAPERTSCFEAPETVPSPAALDAVEERCGCPDHGGGCVTHTTRGWRDGYVTLRPSLAVPRTRTSFGALGAPTCDDRDRYVEPPLPPGVHQIRAHAPPSCRSDAARTSRPVVGIRDAGLGVLRVAELPDGLDLDRVLDAGGMAVVLARGAEGERVLTLDAEGAWFDEGALPFDTGSLLRAEDGTLVLVEGSAPSRGARAWLRAPVEPGAPGAWSDVSRRSAVAYAPIAGGRALVAEDDAPRGAPRGDLSISVVDATARRLLTAVHVDRDPEETEAAFDGEHLFLHTTRDGPWLAVGRDGAATPTSSCLAYGRCDDAD